MTSPLPPNRARHSIVVFSIVVDQCTETPSNRDGSLRAARTRTAGRAAAAAWPACAPAPPPAGGGPGQRRAIRPEPWVQGPTRSRPASRVLHPWLENDNRCKLASMCSSGGTSPTARSSHLSIQPKTDPHGSPACALLVGCLPQSGPAGLPAEAPVPPPASVPAPEGCSRWQVKLGWQRAGRPYMQAASSFGATDEASVAHWASRWHPTAHPAAPWQICRRSTRSGRQTTAAAAPAGSCVYG